MGYSFFFFQAEDGIRDLVRSRGLGDVYKRQQLWFEPFKNLKIVCQRTFVSFFVIPTKEETHYKLSLIHI